MQYLGKYEIIAEIGRGAMGAVYKARDPLIDRLVALKTITGGPSAQSNLLDRFYQEARSAGALQHPNIVTIYELGHEKNTPFIAMEYLEGESLDRIIEQHPVLPLSVKLGYIVRVCDALAYAHQHNVVHRDVKPANIMVTKEGVVKVVDFGIARLTDMSMTQPNMMIGSRAYMSPQLYKGERADARSDIWAVGVSLYELLAFKRPFTGDSEAELMFHIIYEKPEELLGLSPECTEELLPIVNKMLEKKSEDRYQSMEDLLHAIEPIWKAAQQATVSGLLADCQQLVVAKDLQRAQALLRKALHIDVGNTQAKSMLEKVSVELRRTEILPRLEEHVSRAQGFLKAGQLREAKAEAQAALGLDSKHEPAHKLLAEVEVAAAKAQQLEQKLKLTKQRLAEGALTEAAAALGQALELDEANLQARELKKQIEEERVRREKRKKLGEILHRARTLWTELNYDECLTVLAAAFEEFPNDPELRKLQDSARTDQAEQQKQRQMAEVRRLLGQQNFVEARKILDVLVKDYPQDTAVKNLQNLSLQEEQEQQRQKRLESEVTGLRGLLGAGKFKQVVTKGEPLLQEYPQDYELKELVNYARGEVAQQEQKRKEEEREKQIQGFLMCERYAEALDTARKAVEEFPKQDAFRKLAAEAEALKKEEDDRERARNEMQRRVREINSKINLDKITDAIDLAQQTMVTMGPDPNVTQLLHGAEEKRKKKEEAERKVTALETLVNKGDHAGATQLFNEVMATQILQASDPRLLELRGKISSLGSGPQTGGTQIYPPKAGVPKTGVPKPSSPGKKEQPAALKPVAPSGDLTQVSESAQNIPAAGFSATRVIGAGDRPAARKEGAVVRPEGKDAAARKTEAPGATVMAGPGVRQAATPSGVPADPRQSGTVAAATAQPVSPAKPKPAGGDFLAQVLPILRRPPVLAGIGVVVVVVLALMLWPHKTSGGAPSARDLKLKQQAEELWQNRQFDQSEQVWQGLANLKGPLQNDAAQQVTQIEQKRAEEQKKFDDGEALLKEKKDYAGARQAFQDVMQLNLWHSADATRELEAAKLGLSETDVHKQEQDLFDQALKLFQANDLEGARKGFRDMLDLSVSGSTLKPQAEGYLNRIRQTGNDEKTYTAALQDFKEEKFAESRDGFQELVKRKVSRSADAKKQLAAVDSALGTVNTIEASIRSGAFRTAKGQLDSAAPWSKTRERLSNELRRQEQQEFDGIKSNAQALESKNDLTVIQRAIEDLHGFEGRAEDPALLTNCKEIENRLNMAYSAAVERNGDKAAFDAAVLRFNQAQQRKDADALRHLIPEFQSIANGTGNYKVAAAQYVSTAIPNAIQELTQASRKVPLAPIPCDPGRPVRELPSVSGAVTCAQLDANPPLQWIGVPMVDFPDVANQPGKLPYSLNIIVTVEPNGDVKVDKDGNPDKDFFQTVKDASRHWRTTPPKSEGKPVTVRFPLTIVFQR